MTVAGNLAAGCRNEPRISAGVVETGKPVCHLPFDNERNSRRSKEIIFVCSRDLAVVFPGFPLAGAAQPISMAYRKGCRREFPMGFPIGQRQKSAAWT